MISKYTSHTAKEVVDQVTKTYNSYSGCDILAMCEIMGASIPLGTLQTISYSVHMERHPVRSIGNVNAKDYTQGPRTVAGSLVFAVFDKHILYHMYEALEQANKNNKTKLNDEYLEVISNYQSFYSERHMLADELPPFNITIAFANEYGSQSRLALYGVRLVNEGQVMSINDVYVENTYQFVATDIDYMSTAIDEESKYTYIDKTNDLIESDNGIDISIGKNRDNTGVKVKFINYNTDTTMASFKIYHINEDEDYVPLDGGVLRVDCLSNNIKKEDKTREFTISSTTPTNPIQYIDLRLDPGLYSIAYYNKDNTNEPADEIKIELVANSEKAPAPFIYNIYEEAKKNDNQDEIDKCIIFYCPGALSNNHNTIDIIYRYIRGTKTITKHVSPDSEPLKIHDNEYKMFSVQSRSETQSDNKSHVTVLPDAPYLTFLEYIKQFDRSDIEQLIVEKNKTDPSVHLPVYIFQNKDGLTKDGGLIKKENYPNVLIESINLTNKYLSYLNDGLLDMYYPAKPGEDLYNYYTLYCGPNADEHNLMQQITVDRNNNMFNINDHIFEDALLFVQCVSRYQGDTKITQPYYIYNPGGAKDE